MNIQSQVNCQTNIAIIAAIPASDSRAVAVAAGLHISSWQQIRIPLNTTVLLLYEKDCVTLTRPFWNSFQSRQLILKCIGLIVFGTTSVHGVVSFAKPQPRNLRKFPSESLPLNHMQYSVSSPHFSVCWNVIESQIFKLCLKTYIAS